MAWKNGKHVWLIGGMLLAGCMTGAYAGDLREAAWKITLHEIQADGWAKLVKQAQSGYETAVADDGATNRKRYLDDKLIALGSGLGGKNIDEGKLREFVFWLALYWEWQEPLPQKAQAAFDAHRAELEAALENFSWQDVKQRLVAHNTGAK